MASVCILSCQHVPDDMRVTHRIGRRLREVGFDVTWVGPERGRTGEAYGIKFVYYPASQSRLGRLTHGIRLWRTVRRIEPHDVYLAVEPDSAEVALRIARATGGKAILDIHEIYHEEMLMRWLPRPLVRLAGGYVQRRISRICHKCDLVVGVGQTRLDPYTDETVPRMVVRHCVPTALAPRRGRIPFDGEASHFVVIHGKATMNHGTSEVLHAIAALKSEYSVPCRVVMFNVRKDVPNFQLTDVGRLAEKLGVAGNIDLRDPVPFGDMFPLMRSCDVGVNAYQRTWGQRCMPNRVFEYMAVGLPVVVPVYAEEMVRLVSHYRCGVLCDTSDPKQLAQALLRLWQDKESARRMGLNGREAFERELNWERESKPLIDWIDSHAGQGRHSANLQELNGSGCR
jgi:glycosyltransferase involved in cell wall biosynthesis